jgi:hypothetical protein
MRCQAPPVGAGIPAWNKTNCNKKGGPEGPPSFYNFECRV